MLTGGKDSRLSLLSLYADIGPNVKTFTHKKEHLLNDINDIKIPKELVRLMHFNHLFTYPRKNPFSLKNEIKEHSNLMFGEMQPGSTYYYYLKSNWFQVKEDFLIDNYYEIGRMHLHGSKNLIGAADKINLENMHLYSICIDKDEYEKFNSHLTVINNGFDLLDIFYFMKNFSNVGYQFEMIDYSHTPLIFCNSLNFFRQLLSVPEE
jgi:hypothetical protein